MIARKAVTKLLAVSTTVAVLAALVQGGPAAAQGDRGAHAQTAARAQGGGSRLQSVHMSGQLQALSQSMITHSLLAALSIERKKNVKILAKDRDKFVRTVNGLRHGDEKLGLRATKNPKILEKLDRLEREWSIFGPAVQSIIDSKRATAQNVAIVAECILPIAEATRELIDVYEFYATGGRTFSVLTGMVSQAEAQHALLKEMTAGFLLVAYGHKRESYRARLWAYQVQFDMVLRGLIEGNPRLKLLPAPDVKLRARFRAAREKWIELLSITKSVAEGGVVDPECISDVTKKSRQLAVELGEAVDQYKRL
jgi:hypothetical protein